MMTWDELAKKIAEMPVRERHAPVTVYDPLLDDFAEAEFVTAPEDTEIYGKGECYLSV